MKKLVISSLLTASLWVGWGQTTVDLATQSKNVDFSNAPVTRTIKTGTVLPATCSLGSLFFRTNAVAGQNIFACTGTNTWSVMGNATHSHTLAGDATGDLSSVTVTALQNRTVSTAAPASGQVLAWNATNLRWEPQTVSGGGGGGGASSGAQLTDLTVARASGSLLTIGSQCSTTAPCNVRFGNTVYAFTASASVTLSSGTGSAFVYISRDGVLTVGHNLVLNCSGCTAEVATAFPADSVPLFRWTATANTWDNNGGTDVRAFLSGRPVLGGTGIAVTNTGGNATVAVNTAVVGLRTAVPATAASGCTSGAWAADSTFSYICVADNTWRRVSISAW
jgi:hypothetical protein